MTKLILPLLSLLAIGAAAPALNAADSDDCGPSYTITRTWVEGHWEAAGCNREEWVPGQWVVTRTEQPRERVVVVYDHGHDHDWHDGRGDRWHDHDEHEHEHQHEVHTTAVVAPLPVPVPLPVPFPFPFFHRH
jgi:hypothetical protein